MALVDRRARHAALSMVMPAPSVLCLPKPPPIPGNDSRYPNQDRDERVFRDECSAVAVRFSSWVVARSQDIGLRFVLTEARPEKREYVLSIPSEAGQNDVNWLVQQVESRAEGWSVRAVVFPYR